jgi:hypothetical protein
VNFTAGLASSTGSIVIIGVKPLLAKAKKTAEIIIIILTVLFIT